MSIFHPWWCGRAHHCTAARGGQHRSAPLAIRTRTTVLVATRTRTAAGRNGIEFRAHLPLPSAEKDAHQQARHLAARITTAISARRQ